MTMKSAHTQIVRWLAVGSLGMALGIFLAPRSGHETRQQFKQACRDWLRNLHKRHKRVKKHVQDIFGKVTTDLEQAYQQVYQEVIAQRDALHDTGDMSSMYRNMIAAIVGAAAKEHHWNQEQIAKFTAHLEREFEF
jgi:gas vesicle protein